MRSRGKILAATLDVIARDGFDAVTIAAVSQAAGVSRQTIYAIFGTREALVTQAMEEFAFSVFAEIRDGVGSAPTSRDYVVDLIVSGRRAVRTHPVLTALLRRDSMTNPILHVDVLVQAEPIVRQLMAPMMDRYPDVTAVFDDLAMYTLRIAMSIILFDDPTTASDEDLRAFLRRWVPLELTTVPDRP